MSANIASMTDAELRVAASEFAKALEDNRLGANKRDALLEAFRTVEDEMRKRKLIRK